MDIEEMKRQPAAALTRSLISMIREAEHDMAVLDICNMLMGVAHAYATDRLGADDGALALWVFMDGVPRPALSP